MADIKVKDGCDADFQKWFEESNTVVSKMPGFKSRKLFYSHQGSGAYRIVMTHESKSTFVAMHNSPDHGRVFSKGRKLMDSDPIRSTFEAL